MDNHHEKIDWLEAQGCELTVLTTARPGYDLPWFHHIISDDHGDTICDSTCVHTAVVEAFRELGGVTKQEALESAMEEVMDDERIRL